MAEWFKAPVLKTGLGQLNVGSNPSLSATGSILCDLNCPGLENKGCFHFLNLKQTIPSLRGNCPDGEKT